ncbi:MAG: hypothetical protein JWO52_867 [Gammaproteobacteria bacterium]|jgi:hypothetical protein|nr:hypothetical protein [Gammaproteobacteria bacterium]
MGRLTADADGTLASTSAGDPVKGELPVKNS